MSTFEDPLLACTQSKRHYKPRPQFGTNVHSRRQRSQLHPLTEIDKLKASKAQTALEVEALENERKAVIYAIALAQTEVCS